VVVEIAADVVVDEVRLAPRKTRERTTTNAIQAASATEVDAVVDAAVVVAHQEGAAVTEAAAVAVVVLAVAQRVA